MSPIRSKEHSIMIDVDDTLVMWHQPVNDIIVECPYSGDEIPLKIHKRHVKLLKDHYARGYCVVVWSAAGVAWADAVVDALELRPYIYDTLSKPQKFIDDLPATEVLVNRLYLNDKEAHDEV